MAHIRWSAIDRRDGGEPEPKPARPAIRIPALAGRT
jgi:hypothetical protein